MSQSSEPAGRGPLLGVRGRCIMGAVDVLDLVARDDGVGIRVLVKPRASVSRVIGVQGDALAVAVAAPPVEGAANRELIRVLAHHLGLKRRAIRLLSGDSGRRKVVCVAGLDLEGVRSRLEVGLGRAGDGGPDAGGATRGAGYGPRTRGRQGAS